MKRTIGKNDPYRTFVFTQKYDTTQTLLTGTLPCFSLKSKISYFKVVEKRSGISYNHSYITPTATHRHRSHRLWGWLEKGTRK